MSANSYAAQENPFSFKKLLMPGAVIEAHAEFEGDCASCHGDSSNVTPNRLCLKCHELVSGDMDNNVGFHSRAAGVRNADCIVCHTEHVGRSGSIIGLDQDGFDHRQTDFELLGNHAATLCSSCHMSDQKYRDASSDCFSCHQGDDRHQRAMGEQCQDCHSDETWTETKFDHAKTGFELAGQHQEIQCNSCHPDEKYEDTPGDCLSCHALNDVHLGKNGDQCDRCHGESDWQTLSFDHNQDTDFKLKGGHSDLACNACHEVSGFEKELSTSCADCHSKDDPHNKLNGAECESCHGTDKWVNVTFDHDLSSDFSLLGKHQKVGCESCHQNGTENVQVDASCVSCHRIDDVHSANQGEQCGSCHNPDGWSTKVRFSHDLTDFPLVGMHAIAACEACHESQAYSDTGSRCIDCHTDDDSHQGALGPDCSSCHNPNDWLLWLFDHDQQTRFKLEGAHQSISCNACHKKPMTGKVKQSAVCANCHRQDDKHNGRYGRACDRCHSEEKFSTVRLQ